MSAPALLRCPAVNQDGHRCDLHRFHLDPWHKERFEHGSRTWKLDASRWMETAEQSQPWVIYTYGRSHDGWWPFWSSTRVIGRARIGMECMVCGHREVVSIPMPRFGPVPPPESGRHPERERFLREHAHPDRGAPMSWARPLRNLAAHPGGLNVDAFAMRLAADINEDPEAAREHPEPGGAR